MPDIILEINPINPIILEIQNFSVNFGTGGGGGATNLSYTASPTEGQVNSDTGTDAVIPASTVTNAGLFLPAEKSKLAGVETGAQVNNISDVNATDLTDGGDTNLHIHDSRYYTEGEVNTLLTSKENTITAGTTAQYYRGDKTFQTLDKTAVGLANVDNTSDLNKPVSTATQTALNLKVTTNTAITGATKTKITYDSKGLVTAGADATASDFNVDTTGFKVVTDTNLQTHLQSSDTALLNARGTGVRFGGIVTLAGATTVNVTAGAGEILDNTDAINPTYTKITWTAQTAVALATLSPTITYWYFDDNSNVIKQQTAAPTISERRTKIFLFRTSYTASTINAITGISSEATPLQQAISSIRDFSSAVGSIKTLGLDPTFSGANRKLKITSGDLFSFGSNYEISYTNPHIVTSPTFDTGVSSIFRYAIPSGVIATDQTDIQVANYAPAGVVTAIPGASSRAGIHYVFKFPGSTGNVRIVYGDNFYNTVALAIADLSETKARTLAPSTFSTAFLLGAVIATKAETSLINATFVSTNKFGGFGGSAGVTGVATTTLQQAYNNSTTPEILTGTTQGALSIRRGSASDSDAVFETLNGAGTVATTIRGDGVPTATSDLTTKAYVDSGLLTKENTITAGTTGQYYRGDKTFQTLDKTAVGLGNVDNTSDANKPISTATQTALNAKQDTLVSGTNIKTINSTTILGSGNINTGIVYTYVSGEATVVNSGASDVVVASVTIPANFLQVNDFIEIKTFAQGPGTVTGSGAIWVRWLTTTPSFTDLYTLFSTTINSYFMQKNVLVRNTSIVSENVTSAGSGYAVLGSLITPTIDRTVAQTIQLVFRTQATTFTLYNFIVQVYRP